MKFTALQVNHANEMANNAKDNVVSRALNVFQDPQREKRLKECLCLACAYIRQGMLAGQTFTRWTCAACEKPQPEWPNTAVPKLCLECADRYGLCVRCIADLDLRARRKVTRNNKFRKAPFPRLTQIR